MYTPIIKTLFKYERNNMKKILILTFLVFSLANSTENNKSSNILLSPSIDNIQSSHTAKSPNKYMSTNADSIVKPLYKPLVERYILDELKSIRSDNQQLRVANQELRADVAVQVSKAELGASDRALTYTTNTMSNIFYVIALVSSLILIVGVKSIKDIKESSEELLEEKINTLTQDFEGRLLKIEQQAQKRFKIINENQEKIEKNETISALWKRAALEENNHAKIDIYDEIIKIRPNAVEALVYKAGALLELKEAMWALSLSNQAIELDKNYALAYWQRACANTALGHIEDPLNDIKKSIELSPGLIDKLESEIAFTPLKKTKEFKSILNNKKS